MNKTTVLANFKRDIRPIVIELYGSDDKPVMRFEWGMYVDRLCRDGEVTDKQRMTWLNPF